MKYGFVFIIFALANQDSPTTNVLCRVMYRQDKLATFSIETAAAEEFGSLLN
jgi:hypothetical protein